MPAQAQFSRLTLQPQPTPCLILVQNIAPAVSVDRLREFFSFCGHIQDLEMAPVVSVESDSEQKCMEALLLFTNPVAAKTATMLTNARLDKATIQVNYYFPQYSASAASSQPASQSNQRDQQANKLVVEWVAKGLELTDQLVAAGRSLMEKYRVIETVQPYLQRAQSVATAQATKLNETFHLTDKAQQLEDKYRVTERVTQAKAYVYATVNMVANTAMQYPIVQKATEAVQQTASVAQSTFAESKAMYDEKRQRSSVEGEPSDAVAAARPVAGTGATPAVSIPAPMADAPVD